MFGGSLLSIRRGRRPPFLGLDIGNYSVKALKFGLTKRGPIIEDLVEMEIPLEIRQSGRKPEALAEVVKTCLAKGGILNKDAVVMVTGTNAFIRRILMPPMPMEELEEAIPFEAAKYVPFPIEDAALDYTLVGERKEGDVKKLDILLVAVPKEVLEQEASVGRAAGLEPLAVNVAPIALWNTFQLSETGVGEEIVAQLDIGYKKSTICFFNRGILEFSRTINVGGNDITESLMSAALLGGEGGKRTLTYDEAEAMKFKHGFPPSVEQGAAESGIDLFQVSMLMRPVLEKLLNEIRTSFEFYGTKFAAPRLDKVILSGGGSMLKGLKDFLSGELGIEVKTADTFQRMNFAEGISKEDVKDVSPAFAVVFGLAAWEIGDLSLLPRKRHHKQERSPVFAFVVLGIMTAMIISYFYWGTHTAKTAYTQKLREKVTRLAEFTRISVSTRAIKLAARRRELMAEINTFPRELRQSIDCADALKRLRHSLPNNIHLKEVNISPTKYVSRKGKKEINVRGAALAIDERGPTVSDFMTALEGSPVFNDVRLLYMEEDEGYTVEGSKFHLSFQCNPVGD